MHAFNYPNLNLKKLYKPDRFLTAEAKVYGKDACCRPTLNLEIDATKSNPESFERPKKIV